MEMLTSFNRIPGLMNDMHISIASKYGCINMAVPIFTLIYLHEREVDLFAFMEVCEDTG